MTQAAPAAPHRVAFLGTPAAAATVLTALAKTSAVQMAGTSAVQMAGTSAVQMAGTCAVRAVFCSPDRPSGRGLAVAPPPVKAAAMGLGLDVRQPENWRDGATRSLWESLEIDMALVVAYGHILPPWMLDGCRLGAWNLHFSLLPRWRGAAPVNHAILAGDAETGVSLMKMVPGLDAGPVLAQCRRPIWAGATAGGLLADLAEDAAGLLKDSLGAILGGSPALSPQDEKLVTLAPKLKKGMARLDLSKGAPELHRQIRALQPWPGAEVQLGDTTIKILEVGGISPSGASPGSLQWDNRGARLTVPGGSAIELVALQRPGRPAQPARQALQPWGGRGEMMLVQNEK
jgi:methionyl-tRNA formyltransferase